MNLRVVFIYFQINVETQRGFVPVDERMRVIDANGNLLCNLQPNLFMVTQNVLDLIIRLLGSSLVLHW